MAGANSSIQLTDLDFDSIKGSLKTFLKSQDTLKDYNYEGSALSVLLDVLAVNTQFNAYYLNMVANEMFMDTALKRSSVVSHAKLLNYVPKSALAPSARVNVIFNNVYDTTLTLPKNTRFISEAIDGTNYTFVTTSSATIETDLIAHTATFNEVVLKQGEPVTYGYTVDTTANPKTLFELPDSNIDTTTLTVSVRQSTSNNYAEIYTLASDNLYLTNTSKVYFLQEGLNGNYEIYFGDGTLGKALIDGNVVSVNYLITKGSGSYGANNFTLQEPVAGYSSTTITSISSTTKGSDKESIDSIKYQAPKAYSSQKRAVTRDDYITAIQQNSLDIPIEAVSVWGGQDNATPSYGQVFVALKPKGSYLLTDTQKLRLINEVIKPISVLTVTPNIVDPDYTYLKLTVSAVYDPKKTTSTAAEIKQIISDAVYAFADKTLNTFNSTFQYSDLIAAIQNSNRSIVANDVSLRIQKKIILNLTVPKTYTMNFGVPLERGLFLTGISSTPTMKFRNPSNASLEIDGVFLEEIPTSTGGIESIQLLNAGYNYLYAPKITIEGDGSGAEAYAVLDVNNTIKTIIVSKKGTGYTSAIVKITNDVNDKGGQSASAVATLEGRYGSLRTYYNDANNFVKVVLNENAGTIDYQEGILTLNTFSPLDVNDPLGQLSITVNPATKLLTSSFNKIITIDPYDIGSVTVNVTTI